MKYKKLFYQNYLNLEETLLDLTSFIFVTDKQLNTYSSFIGDLIVKIYVEIEAITKELCKELNLNSGNDNKQRSFDIVCLRKLKEKYNHFYDKLIYIKNPYFYLNNKEIKPFNEIDLSTNNGKGFNYENITTKSLKAKKAYQLLKHDKYNNINKGSLENLINSLGTLYLLNIYYKFITSSPIIIAYKEINNFDYSFGSKIFSIEPPEKEFLDNPINGYAVNGILESKESPFILKFTDEDYATLLNIHLKDPKNDVTKYINEKEDYLKSKLSKIYDYYIKNYSNNLNYFELFKKFENYIYSEKFKNIKEFRDKKKVLVTSNEFKNNEAELSFKRSDINEDNFEDRIKELSSLLAFKKVLTFEFKQIKYISPYLTCELMIDNNNIKYKI